MASIDDIFKNAGVPSKRKLEAVKDPNEIYKSSKQRANGSSSSRATLVEADADADDDIEAGPARSPEDHVEDAPDDDEGRFFGGGITAKESEVLDYVDGAGDANEGTAKIDAGWMRKTAQNLEKRMAKNAELRAKHESEPQKFISSEADLDADIKALSILSEHTSLYPDFVKLGCAANLVGLLAHENTDISIDAIEIIGELTDEDVSAEDDEWNVLVDALIDADLLGLLVSNFGRLNEDDEADKNGVYYALGIIENLCTRAATAARVGQEHSLLRWLLQRIQRKEPSVSQNKQYAAEVLAILCQSTPETRRSIMGLDAINSMLELVAPYREINPEGSGEEAEFMENVFEALTCLVDDSEGKARFLKAEGVELCLIMFRRGRMSKAPALRLVDHAAAGANSGGVDVCMRLVTAGGLKALFTLFAKKKDHRLLARLVSIMASMLRMLPADCPERIRTLAKFVEKDYAKTAKLVSLRRDYAARVGRAEDEYRAAGGAQDAEEAALELFSRRLDVGLFTLQQLDASLAWLVAEDGGARRRIKQLLAERDEDLGTLAGTLKEQLAALDTSNEENQDVSDMLTTLLEFLQ